MEDPELTQKVDELHQLKKYKTIFQLLKPYEDKPDTSIDILWRVARAYYDCASGLLSFFKS